MNLYTPLDIAEGLDSYDVSCGPAALAAILRRPVMALRETLVDQGYRVREYMNPTHMQAAPRHGRKGPEAAPIKRGPRSMKRRTSRRLSWNNQSPSSST